MNHAFRMKLKPGAVDEYRKRHDDIWPELAQLLTDAGIHDYSIFLDEETLHLFAVLKLREPNQRESLPQHPLMRRW
jgi:L-rhamnose mutarotase